MAFFVPTVAGTFSVPLLTPLYGARPSVAAFIAVRRGTDRMDAHSPACRADVGRKSVASCLIAVVRVM